jgi:alpha-methylacyl-CoA racemase
MHLGPLAGVRVLELGGVGPVAFCGMTLADLGADVIRIERPLGIDPLSRSRTQLNLLARGKRSIVVDLQMPEGKRIGSDLVRNSDIVIEGFRPGVVEQLGLGPTDCIDLKPAIIFGRMTGWGQGGTLSSLAGHDINYIAISGLLATIGTPDQPLPPLNIVGDFGAALYLVSGVLAALTSARETGRGQIVEASILGGTLGLMAQLFAIKDHGEWSLQRQSNWMDGGAPFYRAYTTRDGRFMAIGAIEPKFYKALVGLIGLDNEIDLTQQMVRSTWHATAERFAAAFAKRDRDEWAALALTVDACCTPVLDLDEARVHSHAASIGAFTNVGGNVEPAPQPLFSETRISAPRPPRPAGADSVSILSEIGRDVAAIGTLYATGVVRRPI